MGAYLVRRLILIVPVLVAVLLLNFLIINWAVPAGPVEQIIAQLRGEDGQATDRIRGLSPGSDTKGSKTKDQSKSAGKGNWVRGLDPDVILKIEKEFGLDKPLHIRFIEMAFNYLRFDFGDSFFVNRSVVGLIWDRMPISISLGLWSTLLIYTISIPLGVYKAKKHGSRFDMVSDTVLVGAYAIPSFLLAVLLMVLFCGGRYWNIFPLSGIVSENWHELPFFWEGILDYFWHMALPVLCLSVGGFTVLTMMTRNFFLEEIHKQYVVTARAKGVSEKKILFGHIFRNAMLIIIAGFPATLIGILFTGTLLLEVIFSLNGLGLLGYKAVIMRDYPIVFGTLYMSVLLGLLIKLVSDVMYKVIDPRIDFESREV